MFSLFKSSVGLCLAINAATSLAAPTFWLVAGNSAVNGAYFGFDNGVPSHPNDISYLAFAPSRSNATLFTLGPDNSTLVATVPGGLPVTYSVAGDSQGVRWSALAVAPGPEQPLRTAGNVTVRLESATSFSGTVTLTLPNRQNWEVCSGRPSINQLSDPSHCKGQSVQIWWENIENFPA